MNFRDYRCFDIKKIIGLILIIAISFDFLFAQDNNQKDLQKPLTIEECVQFALQNNPQIRNASLNEAYVETTIKSKLSEWYPQVGLSYNLQHNFLLSSTDFNGNVVQIGSENTSGVLFGATQTLFNQDVLFASRSADDIRLSTRQQTSAQKINLAVEVSKAFYNIILIEQQSKVLDEDIIRNTQSVNDAYYQYQSGIVDKTDYKRATIALNNSKSQKVFIEERLKSKKEYLKELMGYSGSENIILAFDTVAMRNEIYIDTTHTIDYTQRIEIQQLETQRRLQQYNLSYYKWSFLPDVYAFGNYNLNYLNNQFSEVYSTAYPSAYVGIGLSYPIFQGGKRTQQIKGAEFLIDQVDNDILSFQYSINTEYQTAISNYKASLNQYLRLEENLALAQEVYDIIQLQYRSGVKAFLDVITAESDLKTAQINYFNALYEVLSSKLEVEQALGNIKY